MEKFLRSDKVDGFKPLVVTYLSMNKYHRSQQTPSAPLSVDVKHAQNLQKSNATENFSQESIP